MQACTSSRFVSKRSGSIDTRIGGILPVKGKVRRNLRTVSLQHSRGANRCGNTTRPTIGLPSPHFEPRGRPTRNAIAKGNASCVKVG